MNTLQRAYRFWLSEPFTWVIWTFFQPRHFEREFKVQYLRGWQRFRSLFRFVIPIVIICCSLSLVLQFILALFHFISLDIINLLLHTTFGILAGIIVGFAIALVGNVSAGIVGGIAIGVAGGLVLDIISGMFVGRDGGLIIIIVVGITVGLTGSVALGITEGIVVSLSVGLLSGIVENFVFGTIGGVIVGFAVGTTTFVSFVRLPVYLISGLSALKAYYATCKQPSRVFEYLHRSALYWDERIYLPLPLLKRTLLIAHSEAPEKTLEEIAFIVAERPLQLRAARAAALEIAVRDLEMRKSLGTIAEKLTEVLPPTTKSTDLHWAIPMARLGDASRDAARVISPIGLLGRRQALADMQANLAKVHPKVAFRDHRLNVRLARVVETWQEAAIQEEMRLSKMAQDIGNLDDPYKPGQFLAAKDSLFVGRRDLAQELESSLRLDSHRPAFLLNGERRMGKTSILQQLPYLLGSSYISLFYNLQQPGLYASTATFLGALADNIQRVMQVEKLGYDVLQREGRLSNDAGVYRAFERWLTGVETVLEREERTLLLMFDEFEMLEEIERARYIDVHLLLNWMRSIIQFHPRIALLFSGVKTFDELGSQSGIDWNGYFINVQMLRISFLKAEEARHLILQPTSEYPGKDIFPSDVVDLMLTETGCHPFLLQAMCSALITLLNEERRERARNEDVIQVGEQVLSGWGAYFTQLWNRSDESQQACLETLREESQADVQLLAAHTKLEAKAVQRTMKQLLRRDLVLCTRDEMYSLAVPLFRSWMDQHA